MKRKYLVQKLKHRAHLKIPTQTPNPAGGFDISYSTISSFWMGLENESSYIRAVRSVNTEKNISQIGLARFSTFEYLLGKEFGKGFGEDFTSIPAINPIKGEYFLFLDSKKTTQGRLFRVHGMARDERDHAWVRFELEEIEEQGTGASE